MKKFAKMSLVAAVAVAGTVASAQPLAEAIKNVEVSGTVVYRYNDRNWDNDRGHVDNDPTKEKLGNSDTDNNYKIGVSLSSKVNDDVKANFRVIAGNDDGNFATLNTQTQGDGNVDFELSQVNFSYTGIKNTTVILGKQGLTTPWTTAIDSDGNEQTGTGVLALSTWGPVTAAGGYFNQNNIKHKTPTDFAKTTEVNAGPNDIIVAGLMGSFAGVKAEAWYLDVDEYADSVFVGLAYNFNAGPVAIGLDAKYTTADYENEENYNDDIGQWEASISAKMGIFNAKVAYAESEEDGTFILDSDSKVGQNAWSTDLNGTTDSEYWMFDLGAQVTDSLHIGLNYDEIEDQSPEDKTSHDIDETHVQLTYKMSKNLMGYVRLGTGEDDGEDYDRGRLQIQYSF